MMYFVVFIKSALYRKIISTTTTSTTTTTTTTTNNNNNNMDIATKRKSLEGN